MSIYNRVIIPGSDAKSLYTNNPIDFNRHWAEQAFSVATDTLPFSFVYGGNHSSTFLAAWEHGVQEQDIDATRKQRTLILTDPKTGLQVRAVCTIYTDTPGVDWVLYFTNTGSADTPILEQVNAVDVAIQTPDTNAVVVHRLHGCTCAVDDFLPFDETLAPGQRLAFATRDGRPSYGAFPFFNLDWGSGGVITAIGWSGQWGATLDYAKDGSVHLQAGMEGTHLKLHPGETIRSPRILQLYWSGDDSLESYNLFRRTMFAHILPKIDGKIVTPPIAHLSTSLYELNNSTEANVLSHLEPIKGLGFELFWLDAYWTKDGFPDGMGHYGFPLQRAEPADRFPRGLKPIGDAAHQEGMGFLVWWEPERVTPRTEIAQEHPEWVIPPAGDGTSLFDDSLLFNLGIPEAREFMTRYLMAAIKEYGVDCLRIDFNIAPLPFWHSLDKQAPDRAGMAEIRYTEGLYQMWDEILAAFPHLFIDNCASGGMRIDLETCARSLPLWRTDSAGESLNKRHLHQAALQNQVMNAGLNRYVPFSVGAMMGTTPYWFRSGFNGGCSFGDDCRPADYPREQLRQAIAEGKRIRKYYFGDFYPLSPVNLSTYDWCVLQYHRPEEQDGMVIAYRRYQTLFAHYPCALHGIDPEAEYEVTQAHTYDPSSPVRMKGAALQRLVVHVPERGAAVIVEYRRVQD